MSAIGFEGMDVDGIDYRLTKIGLAARLWDPWGVSSYWLLSDGMWQPRPHMFYLF